MGVEFSYMKIKNLVIKNFKCLGPEEIKIVWNDIVVLVGENNVGKSSVLHALDIFFDNRKSINSNLFRNIKKANNDEEVSPVEITIHFTDLTENDKQLMGVGTRLTSGDDWILRKVFEYKKGDKSEPVQYYTFSEKKEIENIKASSTWGDVSQKFSDLGVSAQKNTSSKIGTDGLREVIDEIQEKHPEALTSTGEYDWIINPGGRQTNIDTIFKNNFEKIFIKAVHTIQEESIGSNSSFSSLFRLLIEQEILTRDEVTNLKKDIEKVGALFTQNEEGNYPIKAIGKLEKEITNSLCKIITAKAQIVPSELVQEQILKQLLPVPNLTIDDGYPTDNIEDQGHGLQRSLILVLLELLARHRTGENKEVGPVNMLMVEEPELYMHPHMERKMKDVLYQIAQGGSFQVICTTHSPVFLDMADKHESIVLLEKYENGVIKKQVEEEIFPGDTFQEQKDRLRMILSFDPTVNEIFFARRIVLVEGDTEIAVFREVAKLLGVELHQEKDTTLINCRGKRTIPAFMRVLNHFGKKYFVLHDKDGDDSFNQIIADLAEEEGLGKVKMFKNKFEEVVGLNSNLTKDKPIQAILKIRELQKGGLLDEKLGDYVKYVYGTT